MEAADITTLIDRCTPPTLARPVAAIMRQASEFEPLLVTIAGKRAIRVLADSKPEAIALTSEAAAAGQPVRIGLAQLDAADLKAAGLTIAAGFDPCEHIAGVGRMFQERRARLLARGVPDTVAGDRAIASFIPVRADQMPPGEVKPSVSVEPAKEPAFPQEEIASAKDPPSWSVYGARRGSSLLIYSR
jgi:type IV secretion system protein VirB1